MTHRDPDFLIIGAMKSGTTTLFRWLDGLPEVELPKRKELDFFSDSEHWRRGLSWYRSIFPPDAPLSGEASPSYTYPENAETAAERIHRLYPHIRLIFTARDPLQRTRSHYRHEVQRGRENRPFGESVTSRSTYVTRSLYAQNLAPYFDRFESSQLLVIRFEDLVGGPRTGWTAVLRFLGLPEHPVPAAAHTPSAEKRRYSAVFRTLWKTGALERFRSLPGPIRNLGKLMLTSASPRYHRLLESSSQEYPQEVKEMICADAKEHERVVGRNLWKF